MLTFLCMGTSNSFYAAGETERTGRTKGPVCVDLWPSFLLIIKSLYWDKRNWGQKHAWKLVLSYYIKHFTGTEVETYRTLTAQETCGRSRKSNRRTLLCVNSERVGHLFQTGNNIWLLRLSDLSDSLSEISPHFGNDCYHWLNGCLPKTTKLRFSSSQIIIQL